MESTPELFEELTEVDTMHFSPTDRIVKSFTIPEAPFPSNYVSTSKYTILTFIPKNLFEQFRRVANLYFLAISILTLTPVSPVVPGPVIIALGIVLVTNAIKEGYEDYHRHKQDKRTNEQLVDCYNNGEFTTKMWQDVNVGDIVLIKENRSFPADLVLLTSSWPDGKAYIETSNLDGETNLKIQECVNVTSHVDSSKIKEMFTGLTVRCEPPTAALMQFNGSLNLENAEKWVSLTNKQLLIRGTTLMNTEWVYGIVVYTGIDTKSVLNSSKTPSKFSNIELTMNKMIWCVLIIQLLLCLISAALSTAWERNVGDNSWYLTKDVNSGVIFVSRIFTFLVLYATMVPISLYVTLEIVRISQAFFIAWDLKMYDDVKDVGAECKTSNLNEELGQIHYIFSDKTGTLTSNLMTLKRVSIAGNKMIVDEYNELNSEEERMFWMVITVCHSALPTSDSKKHRYQCNSPDEVALLEAAYSLGYKFENRSQNNITINFKGTAETFKILCVLDFTSDRKRMSVIIETDTGKTFLLCKGADSVIFERSTKGQELLEQDIQEFADIGLRTLCIAWKELHSKELHEWLTIYHNASLVTKDREKRTEEAADMIERDLTVIGVTGIYDQLGDQVPETIALLLEAQIKIWILTGDKQETAINVAKSCKLIQNQQIVILDADSTDKASISLKSIIDQKQENYSVVISGKSLPFYLEVERSLFISVVTKAISVVCCRLAPLQKSLLVKTVKEAEKVLTLAIGDGANDVSMIQTAHVGIGIRGLEGTQAALAADYVLPQFKSLARLLLVHGRWSYYRISLLMYYFFYKNNIIALLQFIYAVYNGNSGQTFYDSVSGVLYNIVFTSIPIIIVSVLDKDASEEELLANPRMYQACQNRVYFNWQRFVYWVIITLENVLTIFFVAYWSYRESITYSSGHSGGIWDFSTQAYFAAIIIANLKLAIEVHTWTFLHHLSIWLSIILWFLFALLYSSLFIRGLELYTSPLYHVVHALYANPTFWLTLCITIFITLIPDVVYKYVYKNYP